MTLSNPGLFFAMAIAVSGIAAPAQGQCVSFEDRAEMFRLADAVFVGTVQKSEPAGVGGFHVVTQLALFEIERVWKGQVRKSETVGTVEAFEPGTRYIVFATTSSELKSLGLQRVLRTSLECGWAERETENGRNRRWLSGKGSRIPVIEEK